MSRILAREYYMNCLFQMDMKSEYAIEAIKSYLGSIKETEEEQDMSYIEAQLGLFISNREHIDSLINDNLKNWTLDRINKVDLAIVRVAVTEILYDEAIPVKVSINEAVNLANKFGGENSGSFVNGILGEIVKCLH